MIRELLMLAHAYDEKKHFINGWFASEKLDGMRAFWDGGVTRGKRKSDIPWAGSTNGDHVSTGLWSRYGNVIHAPDWFIDSLPRIPLDGELYSDILRQDLMSIVKRFDPQDDRWREVQYHAFDLVPPDQFCLPGKIKNPNHSVTCRPAEWHTFFESGLDFHCPGNKDFVSRYAVMKLRAPENDSLRLVEVTKLSGSLKLFPSQLQAQLDSVTDRGGEGLILRDPWSLWEPKRSRFLIKVKPYHDDEATVIGYNAGKGKHLGRLGSLIVKWNGQTFDLSGFTDDERERSDSCFPIGSKVSFRYRAVTRDGLPQEARFLRRRIDE